MKGKTGISPAGSWGGMSSRSSPRMSLEASAWPGNSGTFFMSAGKDKSGRFSPLWMLKGSGRDTSRQCHHTGDKSVIETRG